MRIIGFIQKVLSIVFWGLLIFGFDTAFMAVLTILAALVHEGGHIGALYAASGGVHVPRGALFGFWITPRGMLSYKEELAVVLAGPAVNIILGVMLLFAPHSDFGDYLRCFGLINLMTALSNILPVKEYDGYKAARLLGALYCDDFVKFENVLSRISFAAVSAFTLIALWFMNKIGEGYWIFIIFFCALIKEISDLEKRTFFEN